MSPVCPPSELPAIVDEVRTLGVSEESGSLRRIVKRMNEHLLQPLSGSKRQEIWENLYRVTRECQAPGWDGYSAKPISKQAVREASFLAECLPVSVATPDIVPEPSGGIGFEWRRNDRQGLVLSVAGRGELEYSAILAGGSRKYGAERFAGEIPEFILAILAGYFSEV